MLPSLAQPFWQSVGQLLELIAAFRSVYSLLHWRFAAFTGVPSPLRATVDSYEQPAPGLIRPPRWLRDKLATYGWITLGVVAVMSHRLLVGDAWAATVLPLQKLLGVDLALCVEGWQ